MNRNENAALDALTESIDVLRKEVGGLDLLADPKTIEALKSLVAAAPVLIELADGYKMAGKAGNAIKWIAGFLTTVVAAYAVFEAWVWNRV